MGLFMNYVDVQTVHTSQKSLMDVQTGAHTGTDTCITIDGGYIISTDRISWKIAGT